MEKYLKSKYTSVIQNLKKENGSSTSNSKKKKNSRRSSESLDKEIEKNPNDIKRKLTFDDAKPRNKFSIEKKKNFKNKSSTNLISTEENQPSRHAIKSSSNQLKEARSQKCFEVSKVNNFNEKTQTDEKSSPLKELIANVPNTAEMKNVLNNEIKAEPVNQKASLNNNTNVKDNNLKEFESKLKSNLTDCTPNNVTAYSFCGGDDGQNIPPPISLDEKYTEKRLEHTLRCSPLLCLCNVNISEECYLSEAFSELDLNNEVLPKIIVNCQNSSEDGNVDMDLINQSVSYQSKKTPPKDSDSQESSKDETLCTSFKQMDITSDKIASFSCNSFINDSNSSMKNTFSLPGEHIPESASLCVFDCLNIPPSSFNSPPPSQMSFENKVAIPGIITLPGGKIEKGVDSNGSTEQHAVFIDG